MFLDDNLSKKYVKGHQSQLTNELASKAAHAANMGLVSRNAFVPVDMLPAAEFTESSIFCFDMSCTVLACFVKIPFDSSSHCLDFSQPVLANFVQRCSLMYLFFQHDSFCKVNRFSFL